MKDGNKGIRNTKILSVSVPVQLMEQLDRIVYFNFLNKSQVVTAAIEEYLEKNYDYYPERRLTKNG